jgi:hypothetical protein
MLPASFSRRSKHSTYRQKYASTSRKNLPAHHLITRKAGTRSATLTPGTHSVGVPRVADPSWKTFLTILCRT